jgi:hypothetical protein
LRLENVPIENFNGQYLQIYDGRFILIDENRETPKNVDFTKLNASVTDFLILDQKFLPVIRCPF